MIKPPKITDLTENQCTPLVIDLYEVIEFQREQIQQLKDEIARLKGEKPKPDIKPSKLDKSTEERAKEKKSDGKRPGSTKKKKTRNLEIHESKKIAPDIIPEGSRFKGYNDYVVQDMIIQAHNTVYRIEQWQTPDGKYISGKLPVGIACGHFGTSLCSFILYLYYQSHVTQPLIHEQLREIGIDISVGQVNRIITEGKEACHAEKKEILRAGLEVSGHINVDDTGARHKGKNGYCTHIGNEWFAWFESTDSKSRINFLKLLRAGDTDFIIIPEALDYMAAQGLGKNVIELLATSQAARFQNGEQWEAHLAALEITEKRHVRIATEGALIGSLIDQGLNMDLVIVSDDAGQFNVLKHALCWVHAERTIHKLVGFNEKQLKALEKARSEIWDFYADLKKYREFPDQTKKTELEYRFDEIFDTKTGFATLDLALKRIHKNKEELLLVLDRPDIPLHNNLSETDIRDYVKKRKISGSTRSDTGRCCRDTFATLKKTCRKLNISFWQYIKDRLSGENAIPFLPDLIRLQAQQPIA
ncbi:transposase IS66 family protein [Desulfobotulus alkaliphilus]|uniref:Transposase IS66 family protein n=1 Tax=Desulfobotulus alkaliphilus TaxID=622671 RepID=A0A562R0L8_9BACT|nr:transposase [Desulfobotulus alkaliphilus]TWI61926.1 transposase IS66 family protein [Desulfobotulus alkaliphilus]